MQNQEIQKQKNRILGGKMKIKKTISNKEIYKLKLNKKEFLAIQTCLSICEDSESTLKESSRKTVEKLFDKMNAQ